MNINTERILNKRFKGAISNINQIETHSQEYRVLAILRYLFPGKYDQMIPKDRPDLQDTINHVGIEVTCAVQNDDMKVARAFTKKDNSSNATRTISECGYEINNSIGFMSISKFGTSDSERSCLHDAIIKKCKKADEYKKDFPNIGLAVLLPEIPTSYAEDHIIDWIKEMNPEIEQFFTFIYVISSRFCIMYDIKSDYVDKRNIKDTDNQLICKIARMTAEGELTLDCIEWT